MGVLRALPNFYTLGAYDPSYATNCSHIQTCQSDSVGLVTEGRGLESQVRQELSWE